MGVGNSTLRREVKGWMNQRQDSGVLSKFTRRFNE